jgi:hypothetical protein
MKILFTLTLAFFSTVTSAQEPSQGPVQDPIQELTKAITEQRGYKISAPNDQCPELMRLERSKSEFHPVKKAGDIGVRLSGYERIETGLINDNFTGEHNHFAFRPTVKVGKSAQVDGDCAGSFVGGGCNSQKQIVKQDSIEFKSSSRVVSVMMLASSKSSIHFDMLDGKVTYRMKGNGVEEVVCVYHPSPEASAEMAADDAKFTVSPPPVNVPARNTASEKEMAPKPKK